MTAISNTKQELAELFSFLMSDREDVRKMAASGLSQMSGDNAELNSFLVHEQQFIKLMMDLLTAKSHQTLGDVLTVFINCAADASVADAFASNKVVQRVMRLLDALEASDLSPAVLPVYKEMALMLLNNLTASTVVAIQDLLQVEDEELAGFFVSRLHSLFCRQSAPAEGEEEEEDGEVSKKRDEEDADEDEDDTKKKKKSGKAAQKNANAGRDLRKWFLQVCLNITRTPDGQRCLLAEDWPETLVEIIADSPNALFRLLAVRAFQNCASVSDNHAALIKCGAIPVIVDRLHKRLEPDVTQLTLAEFVASMLASEEGMDALEQINTKKYLVELCNEDKSTVEELADDASELSEKQRVERAKAAEAAAARADSSRQVFKLAPEVKNFITQSILPFMDDIQDAYVVEE